jgi:hypothetical protein
MSTEFLRSLPKEPQLVHLLNLSYFNPEIATEIRALDFTGVNWELFTNFATRNKVYAIIYKQIKALSLETLFPAEVLKALKLRKMAIAASNIKKYEFARELSAVFNAHGIKHIYLKGMVMADLVYQDIMVRSMSDMDILVADDKIKEAENIAKQLGYRVAIPDRSESLVEMQFGHHIPPYTKDGVSIELHYGLIDKSEKFQMDDHLVFQRAVEFAGQHLQGLMLKPEDMLMHLILHFFREFVVGMSSISQLNDIRLFISHFADRLDWDSFDEMVNKGQLQKQMDFTFTLLNVYFGERSTRYGQDLLNAVNDKFLRPMGIRFFRELKYFDNANFRVLVNLRTVPGFWNKALLLFKHIFPDKVWIKKELRTNQNSIFYLYPAFVFLMFRRLFEKLSRQRKMKKELDLLHTNHQ